MTNESVNPESPWTASECQALADYNGAIGAPSPVLSNIQQLSNAETRVVVAGQQPGVFLTPLYILYKAIAAIKWARHFSEKHGRPAVPVFWIASDDHDFEEIRHAHYLNRDGILESWTYRPPEDRSGHSPAASERPSRSVFEVPAEPKSITSFLDEVDQKTNVSDHKQPFLDLWRAMAADSPNMEYLFARLLMELLGPYGLILLPARLSPLRHRAKSILRREIEHAGESSRLVREAGNRLKAQGATPALHRLGNELNFFLYREGIRCKVTFSGSEFQVAHPKTGDIAERLNREYLLVELENSPEHFSPNVVLRPVIQDAALPTLAMVAGPGERRYLSQLSEVYRFFGVTPCEVLPRPRALLIEPRIERMLKKFDIDADVLAAEDWKDVEDRFLRAGDLSHAIKSVEALRVKQDVAWEQALSELGQLKDNPAIQSAMQKTAGNIRQAMDMLEKRIREEIQRAQEIGNGQWAKLRSGLQPNGLPQERVLGPFAPFLINNGPLLIPWLMENLRPDTDTLQILYLSSIGTFGKS